jgi:hypothetical protein
MPQLKDKDAPEVMFIELCDLKSSGFIQDGTENTSNPIEINYPSVKFIPNVGYRRGVKKEIRGGKEVETFYNEQIRFIRNETEISVQRQKELGIEPSPKMDKIIIEKGVAVVERDANNIGLYDFLHDVYYNKSVPNRSQKATAIFQIIEKDERAEEDLDYDTALADAMVYLTKLSQKVGDKLYKYDEDKIDGLCSLFTVFSDTPATKLRSLIAFAKTTPLRFMQAVTLWEQITETEITQALNLNVIGFDANVALYKNKDKVIKSLGVEKMKQAEKISKLADWFKTSDGNEAYTEFRVELEAAKQSN